MIDNPELAKSANIDKNSVVLIIGTEGATDPDLYKEIIG
jgi:diaminopropionate ammonia-lyase